MRAARRYIRRSFDRPQECSVPPKSVQTGGTALLFPEQCTMKRRDFLSKTATILGAAGLGALSGCGDSTHDLYTATHPGDEPTPPEEDQQRPNVLLMIVDELRLPPPGYGPGEGEIPQLKEILGFSSSLSSSNGLTHHFPGFTRLRQNSVILRNHYIASAACVPSRTSFITGAYPAAHTVSQTDGMFKSADEVRWLDADGIPTLGDWFRAGGYKTHWFGKWHCSHAVDGYSGCDDPQNPQLEPWGFSDWEKSCPESHGGGVNGPAGGVYRDPDFADSTINFLKEKAKEIEEGGPTDPFLAVCSFVNPHDIGYYPDFWYLPGQAGAQPPKVPHLVPAPIPSAGDTSNPSYSDGSQTVLNPHDLPQQLFNNPSSLNEDLSDKPDCHFEYSYKIGFGLSANIPPVIGSHLLARPYQRLPNSSKWFQSHGQFYCYLTYLVNLQMSRVLEALDKNGLRDNTIVVFISDHGNQLGAHGGMTQKWHTAYDETIRTPMVVSSPLVNPNLNTLREIKHPTSLIDLVPTLIGLAGMSPEELLPNLADHRPVELVGADLSPLITGTSDSTPVGPDGDPRPGVLFVSDDNITELPDPDLANSPPDSAGTFANFNTYVNEAINDGVPLTPGPVVKPNLVRCLVTQEWKIARYVDPDGVHPDQWEMYHLLTDPTEVVNLLDHLTGELKAGLTIPGLSADQLAAQRSLLRTQLLAQEERLLHPAAL